MDFRGAQTKLPTQDQLTAPNSAAEKWSLKVQNGGARTVTFLGKFSSLPRFRSVLPLKFLGFFRATFCQRTRRMRCRSFVNSLPNSEFRPKTVSMAQTVAQQWTRGRLRRGKAGAVTDLLNFLAARLGDGGEHTQGGTTTRCCLGVTLVFCVLIWIPYSWRKLCVYFTVALPVPVSLQNAVKRGNFQHPGQLYPEETKLNRGVGSDRSSQWQLPCGMCWCQSDGNCP